MLSIYFTAGFPKLNSLTTILPALEQSGVSFVEVGMPFSDPLADGPVIQKAAGKAIQNGMTIELLFQQLISIKEDVSIPKYLMGYLNPVMQYGTVAFLDKCVEANISGLILPDLPLGVYQREWKAEMQKRNIAMVFLVTPQTKEARIRELASESSAFLYIVSTASTTGNASKSIHSAQEYLQYIESLKLNVETVVGFNIKDHKTYKAAIEHHNGAIIGSAFINHLEEKGDDPKGISSFIQSILNN